MLCPVPLARSEAARNLGLSPTKASPTTGASGSATRFSPRILTRNHPIANLFIHNTASLRNNRFARRKPMRKNHTPGNRLHNAGRVHNFNTDDIPFFIPLNANARSHFVVLFFRAAPDAEIQHIALRVIMNNFFLFFHNFCHRPDFTRLTF